MAEETKDAAAPAWGVWVFLLAVVGLVGAALFAFANPNCAAGQVCVECLKGAAGGAIVGLLLVAVRMLLA